MAAPMTNLTHAECRARGAALAVTHHRVALDLRRADDPDTTAFDSRSTIAFHTRGGPTWVDLIAERVVAATLDGRAIGTAGYDGARLALPDLAPGAHELVVEAVCRYSRTGEGLHRFVDPVDGATYLYTHFEPTDARRVFATFEQPDLKARFTVAATVPRGWPVVSGQPEVGRADAGDPDVAAETVTFAPTPPLSGYLVALAAGPYHRVDDVWRSGTAEVPLGVLCRASAAAHLDAGAVLDVTRRGLDFYTAAFGPYPWGKYDTIFVPEYNLGAMENPGLVTFNERFLHRGTATRADRARRAEVVLHEMAHMWFGDLVTPRWWDGTWLKESFADLMGHHAAVRATEFDGAWVAFAGRRKAWAYRQDQLPTTHPVVAEVADLEAARQVFDGITYAKGAAVLKQLMAHVGEEAFLAGARDYFARHAHGNTELADLLDCLERASGRALAAWSRAWLETAGLSRLTPRVETGADGRITRLTVANTATDPRTGDPLQRPHRVTIGLYDLVDGELRHARAVPAELVGPETAVPGAVGGPAALVLVDDEDLTYAKVRLDAGSLAAVRGHLSSLASPLSRTVVWSALYDAVRDAELPAADLLDVACAQLPREPAADVLDAVLGDVLAAVGRHLPAAARPAARSRLVATCATGLAGAEPDSDAQLTWARRLVAVAATSPDGVPAVRGLLDGAPGPNGTAAPRGLTVDPDLRWDALAALAAQDAVTPAELDAALAADDTMTGRTAHLRAVSSRPGARAATWERATTDESVTNDELRALVAGFTRPADPPAPEYAERYFAALTGWWASRTMTMATVLARGLFPPADLDAGAAPADHPVVRRARAWLHEHPDAPAALRRIVVEELDDRERALRAQAAA